MLAMMIKDEPGRYYQSRIVWLKKQKRIGICCYACDGKCSVIYYNGDGIFLDSNLIALSPQLPYDIVSWWCYPHLNLNLKDVIYDLLKKRIVTKLTTKGIGK